MCSLLPSQCLPNWTHCQELKIRFHNFSWKIVRSDSSWPGLCWTCGWSWAAAEPGLALHPHYSPTLQHWGYYTDFRPSSPGSSPSNGDLMGATLRNRIQRLALPTWQWGRELQPETISSARDLFIPNPYCPAGNWGSEKLRNGPNECAKLESKFRNLWCS